MVGLGLGLEPYTAPTATEAAQPAYTTAAVHFDGATQLSIASLTATDNGVFSASVWIKSPGVISTQFIWANDIEGDTPDTAALQVFDELTYLYSYSSDPTATKTLAAYSDPISTGWDHLLWAGKTDAAEGSKVIKIYRNNVDVTAEIEDVGSAYNLNWNGFQFEIGAADGAEFYTGDMADLWIAPGQSILTGSDISAETRAKFINPSTLKPVDLGADGSTPTGVAPRMFFRRAPAAAASTFGTNLGTGGAFTTTGTLTNAATSPSD